MHKPRTELGMSKKYIDDCKIAIIHDWLVTFAGAEKVLEMIVKTFPKADIYTTIYFLPEDQAKFMKGRKVYTTFLQRIPLIKKLYRNFLFIMPYALKRFNLSGYDLILSSSHAVAKGVTSSQNQLHISYIHTPMRYAWELQEQYLQDFKYSNKMTAPFLRFLLKQLRRWDVENSDGVTHFIANSKYIQKRVSDYYNRDSIVIYPPVDIKKFSLSKERENYFITASRLVPYKKINLIAEAFQALPEMKLIIIGDGPERKCINAFSSSNIDVRGYVDDKTMIRLFQKAKAFIFAAKEDFGILPLEAQACGTPVIAYGEGGALETVVDGSTGIFFYQQTVSSIIDAVNEFESVQSIFNPSNIREHARSFSPDQFLSAYRKFVVEAYTDFYHPRE
jgi:glycosyltransferase involved in cell wall biosynthesis